VEGSSGGGGCDDERPDSGVSKPIGPCLGDVLVDALMVKAIEESLAHGLEHFGKVAAATAVKKGVTVFEAFKIPYGLATCAQPARR
jgi:hypothetical protein